MRNAKQPKYQEPHGTKTSCRKTIRCQIQDTQNDRWDVQEARQGDVATKAGRAAVGDVLAGFGTALAESVTARATSLEGEQTQLSATIGASLAGGTTTTTQDGSHLVQFVFEFKSLTRMLAGIERGFRELSIAIL